MRLLIGDGDAASPEGLRALYAPPHLPWVRANMVSSIDGAATGSDGLSGTVNNAVDVDVFHVLRELADAVLVGVGTAEAEGYAEIDMPTVLVSGRGRIPETLRGRTPGAVRLATVAAAPGLAAAQAEIGEGNVYVAGDHELEIPTLIHQLQQDGLSHVLCEGGPTLLSSMLRAGVVDELCHTTTPGLLGGDSRRIVAGPAIDIPASLTSLIEHEGTLLHRWRIDQRSPS